MRLKACRDQEVSEEKILQVKGIREEVKDMVKDLASQYFYEEAEVILADLKLCRPYMEELARLTKLFAVRFEEKKRSRNLIDFSDMEQYALRILTREEHGRRVPSDTAEEYQRQFYEIMIDEYQDSNLIQETILTSISGVSKGRYNIFMVGDVKQSIYRFRLSRPELFMEKFDTYDLEYGPRQRIDLHKNFRSRGQVLDSVNALFRKLMRRELGGIAYDDRRPFTWEPRTRRGKGLIRKSCWSIRNRRREREPLADQMFPSLRDQAPWNWKRGRSRAGFAVFWRNRRCWTGRAGICVPSDMGTLWF